MGLFDSIMKSAGNAIKNETVKAVNNAGSSVGKGSNRTESFTFASLPGSLAELQAMPEASLDSAFKTTALTIAVLCAYEKNPDGSHTVTLKIKEPMVSQPLLEIKLKAPTRHSAITACKKWNEKAPTIYEYLYDGLIEN